MSTSSITLDHDLELNLRYLKDTLNDQGESYDLPDVIYLRGIVLRINDQLAQLEDTLR
jgi:hypothetical protein